MNQVLYTVDAGEAAILFDRLSGGVQEEVYGEGMHFRIPVLQEPTNYNIRIQQRMFQNSTQSKDLQTVSLATRVLYRPVVGDLPKLHQTYGVDYGEKVLKSIAEEAIKSVVADYDAEQLITMRDIVAERVSANMRAKAGTFFVDFQDISLVDIQFGNEFKQSVEFKQVAAQEAEMQKFLVEAAEHEKEAKIIRAEGEAQAAELLNNAIVDVGQGIIELRKIEAAKDIAHTMSHSRNVAYLPGGGKGGQPMFLNLNVGGQ